MLRRMTWVVLVLPWLAGCGVIPNVAYDPTVFNPFPELKRVAVAPFFNLSDEPTVDGRRFALAYYAELQAIPGFDVVPLSVVETTMRQYGMQLQNPREARRLAQLLGVDAVVIGAVTEYSPYYPPRCGLKVQWWTAKACFDAIPPGYGLPWDTQDEEFIPEPLVFEAAMAAARTEWERQTPSPEPAPLEELPGPASPLGPAPPPLPLPEETNERSASRASYWFADRASGDGDGDGHGHSHSHSHGAETGPPAPMTPADGPASARPLPRNGIDDALTPHSGDSPRRFAPADAGGAEIRPVMSHTRIYQGHDRTVTEALGNYYFFRDDARFGGWHSYLQRSEDFIRFCCHMHISEMLTARGGAGQTRVVWYWSHDR
ncbi:MAG: hypothetical protein BMS9Abin04_049 [Planctomycetia bacterium]|nr:MAG: hypothetical protein BMS9Abin04_049 [Planctomycetia bacterium]